MTTIVRYTGDQPRYETPITGVGRRWWPGELRPVTDAQAAQLIGARQGWELERDVDSYIDETQGAVSGAGILPTVVLLGDSVTDMAGGLRLTGAFEPYTAQSYWGWAMSRLGFPILNQTNAGVAGDDLAAMLARYDADVGSRAPGILVVFGGANSCTAATGANNATILAAMQTQMASIVAKGQALGTEQVVCTIVPVGAAKSWTSDQRMVRDQFNLWLRLWVPTQRGVRLADIADATTDPATNGFPTGESDGGPAITTDGLHPNASGAALMSVPIADALAPLLAPLVSWPTGTGSASQFLGNPTFTGASGASTHPTGWSYAAYSGSPTLAYSYTTRRAGMAGAPLVVAVTGTGRLGMQYTREITAGSSTIQAGDTVYGALRGSVAYGSAVASIVGLKISAHKLDSTELARTDFMMSSSYQSGGNNRILQSAVPLPGSFVVRTPGLVLPALTGYLQIGIAFEGAATWTFDRAAIFKG
jgi:lysophospholipase L1-like esterase